MFYQKIMRSSVYLLISSNVCIAMSLDDVTTALSFDLHEWTQCPPTQLIDHEDDDTDCFSNPLIKKRLVEAPSVRCNNRVRAERVDDICIEQESFYQKEYCSIANEPTYSADMTSEVKAESSSVSSETGTPINHSSTNLVYRLPSVCPETSCQYQPATRSGFKGHMLEKHNIRKPFICPEESCVYRSDRTNLLSHHIRACHPTRREYRCATCQRGFCEKYNLLKHIASLHLDGNMYKCSSCDFKAKLKREVLRHIGFEHYEKGGVAQLVPGLNL